MYCEYNIKYRIYTINIRQFILTFSSEFDFKIDENVQNM